KINMDTIAASAPAETTPHPKPRRRHAVIATAAVLLAAAGATFVWWGNPRMTEGSVTGPGEDMSWANDGFTNTRMVLKGSHPATVTATFSLYNDGNLPFTVHGLDVDTVEWLSRQQVIFAPGFAGFDNGATPMKEVTIAPGEEATVQWSLTMTCLPSIGEGGFTTIDHLRFDTSWLGIPAVRDLPLDQPITITADQEVPGIPAC
ncbi:MAG TPA: hypothetical protein VN408_02750, partial [Actinoplanes sp.]|nr:hypothetical protein [Actinoplanes sp.]